MNIFKLKQNGTTAKTELNAALTTFLAMVYIIPVNALILSDAGMPKDALLVATALITILATIFNGLWAFSIVCKITHSDYPYICQITHSITLVDKLSISQFTMPFKAKQY